jgi:hypothetical protein
MAARLIVALLAAARAVPVSASLHGERWPDFPFVLKRLRFAHFPCSVELEAWSRALASSPQSKAFTHAQAKQTIPTTDMTNAIEDPLIPLPKASSIDGTPYAVAATPLAKNIKQKPRCQFFRFKISASLIRLAPRGLVGRGLQQPAKRFGRAFKVHNGFIAIVADLFRVRNQFAQPVSFSGDLLLA